MSDRQQRVVIAMSGGVDSSLAATLLVEQGYDVVGVTMKLWSYDESGAKPEYESSCCSLDDINNARLICSQMGIPHYTLDLSKRFKELVVANFVSEYRAGRTPNPCVQCNTKIKWQALLDHVEDWDADLIATGHYARMVIHPGTGHNLIARGRDLRKDQSYVLWGIQARDLERTLFPLGDLTKAEVRDLARRQNLRTADTPESQEICFIPDNDYRRYIHEKHPEVVEAAPPGDFVDGSGRVVGQHEGIYHYTVGQRKGLGLATGERVFINRIDPVSNTIRVGSRQEALATRFRISDCNWFVDPQLLRNVAFQVQIRYNHSAEPAQLLELNEAGVEIAFETAQHAITPGQSAVFYHDDFVLGGGMIDSVLV